MTPEFEKTTALLALSLQDVMVSQNRDNALQRAETIQMIRNRMILHMRSLGLTGRGNMPLSTRMHVRRVLDLTRPGWGYRDIGTVFTAITQACENAICPREGATAAQKQTWAEQIAGRQRLLEIALESKA